MNKPIRTLAVGCLLLFGLLLLNVNYVQVFRATSLNDAGANTRARDAECSRERGPILVDGETVARSVPSNDSLKFQRRYIDTPMYANLTGFFSCIYGTTAIENTENSILSGSDERLFVNRMVDLVGNEQPKGGSVLLTIDPKAQRAALDGLQDLTRQFGPTKGAVVALDPTTGAILAMVTQPSYDPNLIASHDPTKARRAFNAVVNAPDQRGLNRGAQSIYPPGSTFKLVTSAAALSNGYTPDSTVKGGTVFDLPQSSDTIHNENGSDCGGSQITLRHALEVSCNVAFADLGVKLGAQTLQEQAEKFGFNDDVLDELPAATSVFPTDLDEPQTALSAIGQYDVAASPLQMALVGAGIANGGAVMKPYIVQQVRSPDLDVLREADPQVLHQAVSASVASELTQMMVDVVQSGTGTNTQIPGVTVAGKTGTANSAEDRAPYAWMVSFAPADDPQVAVAVIVEQTGVSRSEISGNGLAGPIARSVMEAVINR
ncbi:MAG TPA: penicillin-binding protein 2 [Nocardioidaceae bacterium]|jgi:peptidoglycan glycosyltransferase